MSLLFSFSSCIPFVFSNQFTYVNYLDSFADEEYYKEMEQCALEEDELFVFRPKQDSDR